MVTDSMSRLLTKAFESNYPLAISSYTEDNNNVDDFSVFKHVQEERLSKLLSALSGSVMSAVIKCLSKVVEVDEVNVPPSTIQEILTEMVRLGELEPYGVRGGTLVVLFEDRLGKKHKIGRFPLDPDTISTYELQLALYENKEFKVKLSSLIRRLSGQTQQLIVDSYYQLKKKKLYRSSSTGVEDCLW